MISTGESNWEIFSVTGKNISSYSRQYFPGYPGPSRDQIEGTWLAGYLMNNEWVWERFSITGFRNANEFANELYTLMPTKL